MVFQQSQECYSCYSIIYHNNLLVLRVKRKAAEGKNREREAKGVLEAKRLSSSNSSSLDRSGGSLVESVKGSLDGSKVVSLLLVLSLVIVILIIIIIGASLGTIGPDLAVLGGGGGGGGNDFLRGGGGGGLLRSGGGGGRSLLRKATGLDSHGGSDGNDSGRRRGLEVESLHILSLLKTSVGSGGQNDGSNGKSVNKSHVEVGEGGGGGGGVGSVGLMRENWGETGPIYAE